MKLRFYITIAILFILAGSLIGAELFLEPKPQTEVVATAAAQPTPDALATPPAPSQPTSGEPARILVPTANIDLAIEPGYYNYQKHTWTLSNTGANFAVMTAKPNNTNGNTFIYGHNNAAIFKRLMDIKPGDQAIVVAKDGKRFVYQLQTSRDTQPTDTSLFDYQGPPILTVQTCSGAWFQHRRLFTFKFVEVQ